MKPPQKTILRTLSLWPVRLFLAHPWGGASLISLFLSVISGIVVGLQYDPSDPFYSTSTIELIVPYGAFWRALHYYSSQAFFLLLLLHVLVILWKDNLRFQRGAWLRLCLSVPCALLLLFTGYVLRGDATGEAAGAIAEHICLSVPLIGTPLNELLFDLADSGVRKVYIHHIIGLVVLGGVTAWPHLRKYTAYWRNHLFLVLLTIGLSAVVAAPMEPNHFGLLFIAGPWFFLGLQELLRYLPSFLAGVVIPLIPLLLLLYWPLNQQQHQRKWLSVIALSWLLFYLLFSLICLLRV